LSARFAWTYALNPNLSLSADFRLNDTLQKDVSGLPVQTSIAQGRVKEDYATIGVRRSF
jgi:hypothetical protein